MYVFFDVFSKWDIHHSDFARCQSFSSNNERILSLISYLPFFRSVPVLFYISLLFNLRRKNSRMLTVYMYSISGLGNNLRNDHFSRV